MNILADTHILIWYLTNSSKLSEDAYQILENEQNTIYYSIVSLWEIAIKHARKPYELSLTAADFTRFCEEQGFIEYPLLKHHVYALDTLSRPDFAPAHNDPFDRLLLCQAKTDNLLFMTHDSLIPYYQEKCILFV